MMVQVTFFDKNGELDIVTCHYTRLKDGFLILVWTDVPGLLRERVIPSTTFVRATIVSKMSAVFKSETSTEIALTYVDNEVETLTCEFAKVKEGFFIITHKQRKNDENELYSVQQIIPAHRITQVIINSRNIGDKHERNS